MTWADFRHAINSARMPLGIDSVDLAAARVDINDLPPVADEYDSSMTKTVIGLCYELAKENHGNFFLSSHDLAPRLRTTPMQAYRLLKMLVADGVLRIVEPGNQFRANRYCGRHRREHRQPLVVEANKCNLFARKFRRLLSPRWRRTPAGEPAPPPPSSFPPWDAAYRGFKQGRFVGLNENATET